MSFSSGPGNSGRPGMMSEINVTPLVDVMLVLLIIFMVAAPMMTQGLEVNLPKVAADALQTEEKQTVLTIKADGLVFVNEDTENGLKDLSNLAYHVTEVMKTRGSKTVFLKADTDASYGTVAEVLGQLMKAGITNIAMVTDPADSKPLQEEQVKK